ncbi:creatininase family protein [Gaiella sp.]|uniref:creatininase family protein n=1 Tax=Gaiella sp. TaxID=2663207 RepID=UPI003265EDEE
MTVRLLEVTRGAALERGRAGALCLLPVGSLEQHGEHLPVGTDSLLAETVALRAADAAQRDVLVAPTVWAGLSPHHVRLGLTVTLEPELAIALTRSIVTSLRWWFDQVVIVNGHGANRGWLEALGLVEECLVVTYWELVAPGLLRELFPADLGSIGHAGQAETSAMLTVAPELVGETDGCAFEPIRRENDAFRLPDMGSSGVLGDPSAASAEAGERFIDEAVEGLARLLDSLTPPTAKEA